MSLKDNLKKIFKDRNLNPSIVSSNTGVPRANIAKWIQQGSNPDLAQLHKVCEFLGLTIDELFSGKKPNREMDDLIEKFEIHTGIYELSIKKIKQKK